MNALMMFTRFYANGMRHPPALPTACRTMAAVLLALASMATYAHHSAARFDFSQSIPVQGVVKLFEVANPHIKLILEIRDANGEMKQIEFEGHSRNNVYRRGWRPDMLMEGDTVTINIAPTRNGEDGGYIHSFTLADGRTF